MTDEELLQRFEDAKSLRGDDYLRILALARKGAAVRWRSMQTCPIKETVITRLGNVICTCHFNEQLDMAFYSGWLPLSALEQTP